MSSSLINLVIDHSHPWSFSSLIILIIDHSHLPIFYALVIHHSHHWPFSSLIVLIIYHSHLSILFAFVTDHSHDWSFSLLILLIMNPSRCVRSFSFMPSSGSVSSALNTPFSYGAGQCLIRRTSCTMWKAINFRYFLNWNMGFVCYDIRLIIQFDGICNVQLADEIMLISIISLIFIFAHAPVLSNLIYTKHAQWH